MTNGLEPKESAMPLPVEFKYLLTLKLLLAFGAAFFLACTLLSAGLVPQGKLSAIIPSLFLWLGLLSAYLWLAMTGKVVLTDTSIIFRRFGRTTTVSYFDIVEVEDKTFSQRLIVRGVHDSITVEKQLRNFPLFYALLMQRAPLFLRPSRIELPLEIHTHKWIQVARIAFLLVGLGIIISAIISQGEVAWPFGVLLLSIGVLSLILLPSHYTIDTHGIEVAYALRNKIYRWADLRNVRLTRPRNPRSQTQVSEIHFTFADGTLVLNEDSTDYPLTRLMIIIQDALYEMRIQDWSIE